jgi:hypothetical protein
LALNTEKVIVMTAIQHSPKEAIEPIVEIVERPTKPRPKPTAEEHLKRYDDLLAYLSSEIDRKS